MKIKTKLRLGFGFLFVVVLLFGSISLYYMNQISVSAKVILKDNYETLSYTREMRSILDQNDLPLTLELQKKFAKQLTLESKNVTENGEGEAVATLKQAFQELNNPAQQKPALAKIRSQLTIIDKLNMDGIVRKNDVAQKSVEKASLYLITAASFCFLVLFSFIVNFPGFVANPLREFSEAIQEIGRKNYKQRLEFDGTDEFAELARSFNEMVEQLNKWENSNLAKIQSEKLRIEAIIEQMQDAIIGLNEKQEILFMNKVAAQILNLDENKVNGSNVKDLMKKNDLLARIMNNEKNNQPIKIYADQKESYFQLQKREIIVPIFEDQELPVLQTGKTAGTVYILNNITQFKELDEAKTNFIATVSHELKTPISSIKMSLKLMDDERIGLMNVEQKQLVEHIKDDCSRLLKITSELLDLAQVETGNLQLNFVKAAPLEIVNYALNAVRFQAEQKNIQLELISKENLPVVNADVEKTAWVLINFLSNALRYSSEKSKVQIEIQEKKQGIEFSVRDFGKGIDEQYQKRLFDRYFQVPTDGNNKSGSGLGLAISKDFIEAENGKIWVESEIGEGSRFCFFLPVAE
ncbi:PAS domain S-box-containing protein [Pedobacter cryoconitis]|uniref:histidine kinase n=2 Tax=Pedobacter cryoconitis TaxID=188932 RepID=A0A7W8YV87_9SPHI|nr:ATP-binding protein [Pedobacter cryoconitis]MBB5622243.1 PAS domain S-box-containing protein [Pedobacter cryoconitis]MBB5647037.1 PAS domain S-box-containing protein [Pedobacter cryoconitis]